MRSRFVARLPRPIALFGAAALFVPLVGAIADDEKKEATVEAKSAAPLSAAANRLKEDVTYLAHDLREGRGVGTAGIDAAADYIASIFREAGLKPAPGADGYFQKFTISDSFRMKGDSRLAAKAEGDKTLTAEPKQDFTTLSNRSGKFDGLGIAFVGFGITAKDDDKKLNYDEYDGIDVKDKLVIIMRGEPQPDDEKSPFDGKQTSKYATFQSKTENAVSHGAKGILFVNDTSRSKDKDELLPLGSALIPARVPALMISRAYADELLAAGGAPKLAEAEKAIDADLKPQSKELKGVTLSADVTVERSEIEAKNVIGVLEGSGPHADETIVVGAHYDHLGHGGSGSMSFGSRDIHNGADDNASGTATVLEMVRRLSRRSEPLPRRIVFMAFSGEERGLLGSAHYAKNPLYPIKDTVAMVNFDMVGRLNERDEVTTFGLGTSPGLDTLVDALGTSQGLKIKKIIGTQGEFFASDHASFYLKNIPVVFFFTGTHPDYHRPSDDTPLINFDGMARIADMGELLLLDLAKRPKRPEFVKLTNRPTPVASASARSGVYLGSRPSYGDAGPGVKLDGVTEGSPAEKAGLKEGDVIVKFDGKEIENIEDYMGAMQSKKPGDEVEIVVKRDGKETILKAKLGTRPGSQ